MASSIAVLSVAALFYITILLTQLWLSLTFRIWVMGWCVDLTTKSTNPGTKMRSHSSIELYSFYVNEIVWKYCSVPVLFKADVGMNMKPKALQNGVKSFLGWKGNIVERRYICLHGCSHCKVFVACTVTDIIKYILLARLQT